MIKEIKTKTKTCDIFDIVNKETNLKSLKKATEGVRLAFGSDSVQDMKWSPNINEFLSTENPYGVIQTEKKILDKYCDEAASRFSEKYPNVNLKKLFAAFEGTSNFGRAYLFSVPFACHAAVAIKILDMIPEKNKTAAGRIIREYEEYLKEHKDLDCATATLKDSVHLESWITNVALMIINSFYSSKKKQNFSNFRIGMEPAETNKSFEYVKKLLLLIDSDEAEALVEKYKEECWLLADKLLEAFYPTAMKIKNLPDTASSTTLQKYDLGTEMFLLTYSDIMSSNANEHDLVDMLCSTELQKCFTLSYDKKKYMAISRFSVNNPYDTIFSYFYMYMKGDDFFAVTNLNNYLLKKARVQLPWYLFTEYHPDFFPHIPAELPTEKNNVDMAKKVILESFLNFRLFRNIEPDDFLKSAIRSDFDIYRLKPRTKEDNGPIYSDAQIAFALYGILPERDISNMKKKKVLGDDFDLQTIPSDLHCLVNHSVSVGEDNGSYDEILKLQEELSAEKKANADFNLKISELQNEIQRIKSSFESRLVNSDEKHKKSLEQKDKQIKAAHDSLYPLKKQNSDLRSENQSLSEKNAELERKLGELRSMIVFKESISDDMECTVDFPYHNTLRTVIFGGHETFVKHLRPMLPDARYIAAGEHIDASALKCADVIWIQNNCCAHGDYWRLLDEAKKTNIPVLYFGFASAEKCAEQVVKYEESGEVIQNRYFN